MKTFFKNQRGSVALIAVIATGLAAIGVSSVMWYKARQRNNQTLESIQQTEGFYNSEIAAWYSQSLPTIDSSTGNNRLSLPINPLYQQGSSSPGGENKTGSLNESINYYNPENYQSGQPLDYSVTKNFQIAKSFLPKAFLDSSGNAVRNIQFVNPKTVNGSTYYCGNMYSNLPQDSYKTCLSRNPASPPPPGGVPNLGTPSCPRWDRTGALVSTTAQSTSTGIEAGSACSWSNMPSGPLTADSAYATCPAMGAVPSFVFPFIYVNGQFNGTSSLPDNAVIKGIVVACNMGSLWCNGKAWNTSAMLTKNGSAVGIDRAIPNNIPECQLAKSCDYGSPTDLWGSTWTAAEIKSPGFGFRFGAVRQEKGVSLDMESCEVVVYWEPPKAPSGTPTSLRLVIGSPDGTVTGSDPRINGTLSNGGAGTYSFSSGDTVTLTAKPEYCSTFDHWDIVNADVGSTIPNGSTPANPVTVKILPGDVTRAVAYFSPIPGCTRPGLLLLSNGGIGVTITETAGAPPDINCFLNSGASSCNYQLVPNASITLHAEPTQPPPGGGCWTVTSWTMTCPGCRRAGALNEIVYWEKGAAPANDAVIYAFHDVGPLTAQVNLTLDTWSPGCTLSICKPLGAACGLNTDCCSGKCANGPGVCVNSLAPTITSISPTSGPLGTIVTITGTNLAGATSVNFGSTDAGSFTVVNSTTITASASATGTVSVTTAEGTITSALSFTVTGGGMGGGGSPPTITSFSPASGPIGTSVIITGTNFTGTTFVRFGGVAATFVINSPTQITASAPAGGIISVMNASGSGNSSGSFILGGCFTAGTQILTPKGLKKIENIKLREKVYSFDTQKKQVVIGEVYRTWITGSQKYGKLILSNGTVLNVSEEHPFYKVKTGTYVPARELQKGDILYSLKKKRKIASTSQGIPSELEEVTVTEVPVFDHTADVYNFSVSDHNNFFVEGILVHNK